MKNQAATYMQDIFPLDTSGAPISGVRLDATKPYQTIPILLESYLHEKALNAWQQITEQINTIYNHLDFALLPLNQELQCFKRIKYEVACGKKLFFKLNLFLPFTINPLTYGADKHLMLATEWPFLAAVMRWFHDRLHIHYYQMAVGDAATTRLLFASPLTQNMQFPLTAEALIEGRSDTAYGGWGFFFVRKYLNEHHPPFHTDCPMNGYMDSLTSNFLPPGKAGNRLMVYDLNKIQDTPSRGRTVPVPHSKKNSQITLHKVIIGGNPSDSSDQKNYPGCVLINLSKPKLPHSTWTFQMDETTSLPKKDTKGHYILTQTQALLDTSLDILSVLKNQNVYTLHIADALYMINLSYNDALPVPEGYIWCALDPVALHLCCARYCCKTLPMYKAQILKTISNWSTEFVHTIPIPRLQGRQIKSTSGYDSPLFRFSLFELAKEKGLGLTEYHILGFDTLNKCPLVSINGHLGYLKNNVFNDLITQTLYYNTTAFLHHLQPTCLSYAKSYDQLANTTLYQEIMNLFDKDNSGIINYTETDDTVATANNLILTKSFNLLLLDKINDFKKNFLYSCFYVKFAYPHWNTDAHNFTKEWYLTSLLLLAYELSCKAEETADSFIPHMHYGKGYWPSLLTVNHLKVFNILYGSTTRSNLSLSSMYGYAFQYADKVLNDEHYTSASRQIFPAPNPLITYLTALDSGAPYLDFNIYVPGGYGYLDGLPMPNVIETNDPSQIFTATFMAPPHQPTTWAF